MNATTLHTIVGYLDDVPTSGDVDGTIRFQLLTGSTPGDEEDTILECSSSHPAHVDALRDEINPGDRLRVSGLVAQPNPGHSLSQLDVRTIEVLSTVSRHDLVLRRHGDYFYVYDATSEKMPVFTQDGRWVGAAKEETIRSVIAAFEARGTTPEQP
ncbi:hypothetical protein ABZ468_48815 [Streptomyces sp. NPDC005708]|uniref:hypothetical protein n=1 Tax=Streptomyces sp. NPDC005708 TaxID=3154564 RepID=UPI0033F028BC